MRGFTQYAWVRVVISREDAEDRVNRRYVVDMA